MKTQQFSINGAQSNIAWVGRKITGTHNGTIAIKEGTLLFDDNQLVGGKFVIDTTSIKILDITDPETNAQLAGHLASDDFFSSERHPVATFEIRHAEPRQNGSYYVEGALTIKGHTQPVNFDAQVNHSGDTVTASGQITVDRTKYEMKFRSGNFFENLGDNLIYNNFDLSVNLTAVAVVTETQAAAVIA